MTTRRGFLGSLLALAAAPAVAGWRPTPVAHAIDPERYISVLYFGADPTGATDSKDAIQRAIDAATSMGAAVYFPAGVFRLGRPLTLTTYFSANALHFARGRSSGR